MTSVPSRLIQPQSSDASNLDYGEKNVSADLNFLICKTNRIQLFLAGRSKPEFFFLKFLTDIYPYLHLYLYQ